MLNGPFSLQVTAGPAGALGVLLYSSTEVSAYLPGLDATFFLGNPLHVADFALDVEGSSPPLIPIEALAPSSYPCGAEFVVQAAILTSSAPGGVALSNGLRLRVGESVGPLFPGLVIPAGMALTAVVFDDLDVDGLVDMAVSSYESKIAVRLGLGAGQYGDPSVFVDVYGPKDFRVGDYDGNGLPDLAAAGAGGVASVLLGSGGGNFLPAVHYPETSAIDYCEGMTLGDFDTDGALDLAFANYNHDEVAILLGAGDGTFGAPLESPADKAPLDIASADFDSDGFLDVTVASWTGHPSLLYGLGDGTFLAPLGLETVGSVSVEPADLDGDGDVDLAAAGSVLGNVFVFLQGAGAFDPPVAYAADAPLLVRATDVDGDAVFDLATADAYPNTASLLLGKGDGTFEPAQQHTVGEFPIDVTSVDFDSDGAVDLVTANGSSYDLSVVSAKGDGTLASPESYSVLGQPSDVVIQDLNGDGILDVVAVNHYQNELAVGLGVGGGKLVPLAKFYAGLLPQAVAGADLDGDGTPDMATTAYDGSLAAGSVEVMIGIGDGAFAMPVKHPVTLGAEDIAAGDLDRNGFVDLVVASTGGSSASTKDVSVLLGTGAGGFAPAVSYVAGASTIAVSLGDLNTDGVLDVAVANQSFPGDLSILLGTGDGTFPATSYLSVGASPGAVEIADLDGNGALDLAVTGVQEVFALSGNGDGTFATPVSFRTGGYPRALSARDFDGDGSLDLALPVYGSQVSVLIAEAPAAFGLPTAYRVGQAPIAIAAGDLDGNGTLDLLTANEDSGDITVLLSLLGTGPSTDD